MSCEKQTQTLALPLEPRCAPAEAWQNVHGRRSLLELGIQVSAHGLAAGFGSRSCKAEVGPEGSEA